uniref:Cytochrome P450, family 2, subfamily X, polypeptide 9 n=1 Tax=Tetraodon nigroviridis TaxID=99883 RepID=H3CMS3_TETNG
MVTPLVLICLGILILVLLLKSPRPKNFPPGPPVLPLLGNILELTLENPLQDFERLRKTYGNIYSLYLGRKPAVVISGLKTIKEALVTKGSDFSGRPQDMFINDALKKNGVVLQDYDNAWKDHRRFALMTLRNFGMGKTSMEDRINGEIEYIVNTLEKSNGKTLSPHLMFHNAASNIICQVLFGTRYEYDDHFIREMIRCFTENAKISNGPWVMLYDSIPLVRYLPLPFRKAFKNVETIENLVEGVIAEHKKTRISGDPRDFMPYMQVGMKRKKGGAVQNKDNIQKNGTLKAGYQFSVHLFLPVLPNKGVFVWSTTASCLHLGPEPQPNLTCIAFSTSTICHNLSTVKKTTCFLGLTEKQTKTPLRKTYGNIYSLYLGRKPAVVISGLKTIKEALVTKGSDFSGRPQDMFINDAIKTNGVVLQDYDNAWKDHRRFALMTLRNFGMGKTSMEDRINGEIEYIVNTLEKSNGKTLSPHLMFHNAASNIICQVLFGTRYEYDDHFIREMIRCFTENAKISNGPWVMLYDSIPLVRYLPLPFRKAFKNFETIENLVEGVIAEHKKTRISGDPRDFVDCYFDELNKRGMDKTSFSESRLPMYALDLHFAGTDTTSNTLLTGFLYLMNHPHVQERCHQEIVKVLDDNELVTYEARSQMPYMQYFKQLMNEENESERKLRCQHLDNHRSVIVLTLCLISQLSERGPSLDLCCQRFFFPCV